MHEEMKPSLFLILVSLPTIFLLIFILNTYDELNTALVG